MSGSERGLYDKYEVIKDGEPIDGEAFILRPDRDRAARDAILAYATPTENDALSEDLIDWISDHPHTDSEEV